MPELILTTLYLLWAAYAIWSEWKLHHHRRPTRQRKITDNPPRQATRKAG